MIGLRGQDGLAAQGRRQLFLEEIPLFDGLSATLQLVLFGVLILVGLSVPMLLCCLCSKIRQRRAQQRILMVENPYAAENSWRRSLRTGQESSSSGSTSLSSFMHQNMTSRQEYDGSREDDKDSVSTGPEEQRRSAQRVSKKGGPVKDRAGETKNIKGFSKRVSTRHTGQDYGVLDSAAKERIRSIRMNENLVPIQQAKPSAKALKMLGVEETAVARPFDDDIQTRMRRIAEKAGGGSYTAGFTTAGFGNQIASGFKEKREKQLERARARKEREEAKRREREAQRRAELGEESDDDEQPPPPPPEAGMSPGPDKLAAFLKGSSTSATNIDDTI